MEYDDILLKVKARQISIEMALESLKKIGYCPNLFNDDNGHWAIKFDGFQNVPKGDEVEDISITCFIEASDWKDSIYEALIHAMS